MSCSSHGCRPVARRLDQSWCRGTSKPAVCGPAAMPSPGRRSIVDAASVCRAEPRAGRQFRDRHGTPQSGKSTSTHGCHTKVAKRRKVAALQMTLLTRCKPCCARDTAWRGINVKSAEGGYREEPIVRILDFEMLGRKGMTLLTLLILNSRDREGERVFPFFTRS